MKEESSRLFYEDALKNKENVYEICEIFELICKHLRYFGKNWKIAWKLKKKDEKNA